MIILIDMDDTIEQLSLGWINYLNDRYGTHTAFEDHNHWNMSLAFPTLTREQVYAALDDEALWSYVKPIPGAPETLKRLTDEGHKIYIVTASGYTRIAAKMDQVLFRYFPFIGWEQVIITQNKHLIAGDVLIDDGVHNLQGGNYRKILFHARYNADFDEKSVGAVRVYNWDEAYAHIQRISRELGEA